MKIGILGAGQLGRMMALAGQPLGFSFVFYAERETETIKNLGEVVIGALDNHEALAAFSQKVSVITYESENIPLSTLAYLEKMHAPVYPRANALENMQDRLVEKQFFKRLAIPTNDFFPINSQQELLALIEKEGLPLVLKKRRNSYDGKGQVVLKDKTDAQALTDEACQHCLAERFVTFDREVSLIAVRDISGELKFYDICQNKHEKGTLVRTDNKQQDKSFNDAKTYLSRIMTSLDYVGVCTLEFFDKGGELFANELAPRVHNSGHWTIEGAVTSQFENHLRAITNMSLGETISLANFTMFNLLSHMATHQDYLSVPGLKLHDYKKEPRANRKLGHITLSQSAYPASVTEVADTLGVT